MNFLEDNKKREIRILSVRTIGLTSAPRTLMVKRVADRIEQTGTWEHTKIHQDFPDTAARSIRFTAEYIRSATKYRR